MDYDHKGEISQDDKPSPTTCFYYAPCDLLRIVDQTPGIRVRIPPFGVEKKTIKVDVCPSLCQQRPQLSSGLPNVVKRRYFLLVLQSDDQRPKS